jgi:hypothetical protein
MGTKADPVIDEVRQIRHEISARAGHDPARLVAYYIKLQAQYAERLISPHSSPKASDKPAA